MPKGKTRKFEKGCGAEYGLTDEELMEMQEAFDAFDLDGDGTIDECELEKALQALGGNPTPKDIQDTLESLGADKSRKIKFDQFVGMMKKALKSPEQEEAELIDAFRIFDQNGDGVITTEEIKNVMRSIGQKMSDDEVEEMVAKGDLNGDGVLDYQEFAKLMTSKNPSV